jgi:ketosteroid isomerase-like protein
VEVVRSAWESFEVSTEEVLRDDEDVVVIVERLFGRGRQSGAEAEMTLVAAYWFEKGKIVRRRAFETPQEALAATRD